LRERRIERVTDSAQWIQIKSRSSGQQPPSIFTLAIIALVSINRESGGGIPRATREIRRARPAVKNTRKVQRTTVTYRTRSLEQMNFTASIYPRHRYILSKDMGYQSIHLETNLLQMKFAPTLGGLRATAQLRLRATQPARLHMNTCLYMNSSQGAIMFLCSQSYLRKRLRMCNRYL
jgi:hypothetical protein